MRPLEYGDVWVLLFAGILGLLLAIASYAVPALVTWVLDGSDAQERHGGSGAAARPVVVHMCPWGEEELTPCCSRARDELPWDDRLTLYPRAVTCRGES